MNGVVFFLENTLFHLMSPAGSDFGSLLFFGKFYGFYIFSIGNSARNREKKKKHGNGVTVLPLRGLGVPITSWS